MMLTDVSTSEVQLTPKGEMISCKIKITMEEYAEGKKSQLTSVSSTNSGSSGSTEGSKSEALTTTASKSDKATKKG